MELDLAHPFTLLQQLSYLMEAKVGGTTGAVYSIYFAAASNAFKDSDDEITAERWWKAGKLGLEAVMKYGKGEPGDRSFVSLFETLFFFLN